MSLVRLVLILIAGPPVGEPTPEVPQPTVVNLAPQASGAAPRALRYNLLPLRGDVQPGNAATYWIRAGQAERDVKKKLNYDWTGTPLKDLPKKEIRAVLDGYAAVLRFAEQASLREQCDWEVPPFGFDNWDFPLSELQDYRKLAQFLSIRCRLALSEGDFDQAARSLRIGFMLARHLSHSDTLIQSLVGNAIATVMFGNVEEWMQISGSPNLYWSLTALPAPFIDVSRPMEFELNNLERALPVLKLLRNSVADPMQVQALAVKLAALANNFGGQPVPLWQAQMAMAVLAAKYYPDARRYLLANGYTAERLDAMSAVQVSVVYQMEQYDHYRDEVLKLLALPAWQGRPRIEALTNDLRNLGPTANPFIPLLFPAIMKVYESRTRLERVVAGLRCGEALRLYAAAHDGKAPIKFTDITAVPLPIDPLTGKGFDGFYTVKDGIGTLEVPSMFPRTPQLGRQFKIGSAP